MCGWVTGVIDQVDTSALFEQWKAAYDEAVTEMDASLAAQQQTFEEWYAGLVENHADGNGLPIPSPVDAGKILAVNETGDGYVLAPAVTTDKTLTVEGAAADAAATGRALKAHNYLINGDFTDPVNSNGADQYDLGGIETIDRWKKRGTGVVTVARNEGLQITSVGKFSGLFQTIENGTKRLAGKTVTLAAYVLQSPGAYEMMLGNSTSDVTAGTSYGEKTFTETGLVVSSVTLPESFSNGDYLNFYIGEGDAGQTPGSVLKIAWCALYEGAYTAETLPVYCPRGYSIEAAICGGGGALNFKVVGGTTQPTNPSQNTIWVDTDTPVNGYYFSAEKPPVKARNVITFPAANTQKTYNGITAVYNGDGTFTLNGTLTANGDLRLIEPLELDWTPGLKYTFSARHISGTVEMADGGANTFAYGIFQNDAAKYVRGSIGMTAFPELYTFTATAFELTDSNKHLVLYLQCWRVGTVFDNYRFSVLLEEGETATEPDGIADEGIVWIKTGTSSAAEFNALKKNGITVYPLSAKQYVDGAWVTKIAKSYLSGEWKDWGTFLFANGDQFTELTGGWGINSSSGLTCTVGDTLSFNVTGSTARAGSVYTKNKIDVSNFRTLEVDVDISSLTNKFYIGLSSTAGIKNTQALSGYVAQATSTTTGPQTISLNVESFNSSYYVVIFSDVATADVSNVRLV